MTIRIDTRFLGEMDIEENEILAFPEGMLGFEASRRFILLPIPNNPQFQILQDVDRSYVSFVVVDPWSVYGDYEMEVSDGELQVLELQGREHLHVVNVVTLSDNIGKSTVNLLAPVILNAQGRMGKQVVLRDGSFTTRHPLYPGQKEHAHADS